MIKTVPNVTFKIRERDDSIGGDNPFKWVEKNVKDLFKNKNVILFSLPGAFTPTCSTYQLPDFDKLYDEFSKLGIDDIYCISVNDSFVMNAWAKLHKIEKIKVIPDGNGEFTRKMGMLVNKNNLGFGQRSWRYAALINDCEIVESFIEKGFEDNCEDDPYEISSPQNILSFMKEKKKLAV
jgi:peroxiredoxin